MRAKYLNFKEYNVIHARVWDGVTDACAPLSSHLHVREGRIVATGEGLGETAGGVETIDLGGRFLVPGMIDAHVHLGLDPALRTPAEQLAVLPWGRGCCVAASP